MIMPFIPTMCAPTSGSLFPIGVTNVSCTATDTAGNSSTAARQIKVKSASEQVADLNALLNSFQLGPGGSSLSSKLSNIQAAVQSGSTSACGQLDAFLNEVAAQSGKKLTVSQAGQLTAAATRMKAVLGC